MSRPASHSLPIFNGSSQSQPPNHNYMKPFYKQALQQHNTVTALGSLGDNPEITSHLCTASQKQNQHTLWSVDKL